LSRSKDTPSKIDVLGITACRVSNDPRFKKWRVQLTLVSFKFLFEKQ